MWEGGDGRHGGEGESERLEGGRSGVRLPYLLSHMRGAHVSSLQDAPVVNPAMCVRLVCGVDCAKLLLGV